MRTQRRAQKRSQISEGAQSWFPTKQLEHVFKEGLVHIVLSSLQINIIMYIENWKPTLKNNTNFNKSLC